MKPTYLPDHLLGLQFVSARIYKTLLVLLIYLFCYGETSFAQSIIKPSTNSIPSATVVVNKPEAYPSGIPINYVRTWQPLIPMSSESAVLAGSSTVVQQNTQYVDGLGRLLQTVARGFAPIQPKTPGQSNDPVPRDIVAPVVYDAFGRQAYTYLPYASPEASGDFKIDPFRQQATEMQNNYPGEQVYYAQTNYEPSPLNRVQKTMAPGNSWAGNGRGVTISYEANAGNEVVIWNIDASHGAIPQAQGYYDPASLYRTITTDEKGKRVVEYKNKEGQVILKKVEIDPAPPAITAHKGWLCTYYVYDDLNQLRFVISPKATKLTEDAGWNLSAPENCINELCFQYTYDGKLRMTAKKVPGAAWAYMVYDNRDRLVFTQDGNMREKSQWLTTLYDQLNRPVQTGIITYNGVPETLQSILDNLVTGTTASTYSDTTAGIPAILYVSQHDGRPVYQATQDIIFESNFEGAAEMETEIIAPNGIAFTSQQELSLNPLNSLPAGTTYAPLTFTYYDNYVWTTKTYTTTNNSKLGIGNNPYGEPLPTGTVTDTRGLVTGTRVRVLEDPNNLNKGAWLETANFYDSKARLVQVQSDNYKGGHDILTNRYDFTAKPISSYQQHNNNSGNTSQRVYTEWDYDHGGRLTAIRKTLNDDPSTTRTIVQNSYDISGQLKNKELGQQTNVNGSVITGSSLETQVYSYNIRGWLKGLNWENYNELTGPSKPKAGSWFAMDLSYDWGYDNNQYNGNIAGIRWQSAGDGAERSYGFNYDAANRLLMAYFSQHKGSEWKQETVSGKALSFNMKMGNDGQDDGTAYDENGNINQMHHWGLAQGVGNQQIDKLTYGYYQNSNKLKSVTDESDIYHLGDFEDKNKGIDYGYDKNGNMVTDLNKGLKGDTDRDMPANAGAIQYNYLNLPWKIAVKNDDGNDKGTIVYIYDAAGNKLEKRVEELASAANNQVDKHTYTAYLSGFIYENNVLQHFPHEEGRIRPKRNNEGIITGYAYDYFIKDHLGNIRTVLTDENNLGASYIASLEEVNRDKEVQLFDKITETVVNKPNDFDNDPANTQVSKLSGSATSNNRVGPGILLKVMKGDKFRAAVQAWYEPGTNTGQDQSLGSIVTSLASAFFNGLPAASAHGLGTAAQANSALSAPLTNFLNTTHSNSDNTPKAYLNWMILDEQQFELVNNNYGAVAMPKIESGTLKQLITANSGQDINVEKNGYLYVYVSNESQGNVYFDDLSIVHTAGALLEETHYYPFGLTMGGITSRAIKTLINRNKYNGKEEQRQEFSDGSGLEWLDYGSRLYDNQVGRFFVQDMFGEKYHPMSLYQYAGNNPVVLVDVQGDSVGIGSLSVAQIQALRDFAQTAEGKRFLSLYAKKGQTIFGVKFDKQGEYDKKGINLNYTTAASAGTSDTDVKENKQGGININVEIAQSGEGFGNKELDLVKAITHESFIHADFYTKDWLDDKKINYSNLSKFSKEGLDIQQLRRHGHHIEISKVYYQDPNYNRLWPSQALSILKTTSVNLGLKINTNNVKNIMWYFSGSKIAVDPASGKMKWAY